MIDLLYIAGAGFSGSTLLERLLGQINGAEAIGEFRHVWKRDPAATLCGCGRTIAECDFWRQVFDQAGIIPDTQHFQAMLADQRRVDRMRYLPMMFAGSKAGYTYKQDFTEYTEKLRQIYVSIIQNSGCRVIIDSSKDISTLFLLTQIPDVTVRILHLVRDGRAVAYSLTKKRKRPDVIGQAQEVYRLPPLYSSFDWMYRNMLIELIRGRAKSYLRLRYDDMVADPYNVTKVVANFIGLEDADLSFIGPDEIRFPIESHALGGNPMRHQQATVRIKMDDDWKTEFPGVHRAVVKAITWPLLRRYDFL